MRNSGASLRVLATPHWLGLRSLRATSRAATDASEVARQRMGAHPVPGANVNPIAEIALARGDLAAARRHADEAVALARGVHLALALIGRSRVAIAQGEPGQAERDAHNALVVAVAVDSHAPTADALNALQAWPARPTVTVKPPDSAVPQTRCAAASVGFGSKCTTTATTPRLRQFVTP